jgi:hypothetical protein
MTIEIEVIGDGGRGGGEFLQTFLLPETERGDDGARLITDYRRTAGS